jgi:hypothetical protein
MALLPNAFCLATTLCPMALLPNAFFPATTICPLALLPNAFFSLQRFAHWHCCQARFIWPFYADTVVKRAL